MKTVERNRYDGDKIFEKRILTYEPYSYDEIEDVIEKIQENLSGDLLKGKRLKYATMFKNTNIMDTAIIHLKLYFFSSTLINLFP